MIQVLKCKCGEVFAACQEPMCYTEKDWLKDLTKTLKEGGTIAMVEQGNWNFGKCKCDEIKKAKDLETQPELF